MITMNHTSRLSLDHHPCGRHPLGRRLLAAMLPSLSLTVILATVACDEPAFGPLAGEAAEDEAALDAFMELAAQERWDDGLEEYLDLSCDASACPWVWTDELAERVEAAPQIPEANDGGATTLTAAQGPAAAGAKTVEVTQVHCNETEDHGKDEPYLLMNGVEVWYLEGVKNGGTYAVGESATTKVLIELWERDLSVNDKIGAFTVQSTKPNGNYSTLLTGDGGNYRVYYTVRSS